ncbi:MAG TPA: head-tail connector protein [Azonexus sp.]|nr:head-tail connector protein [Azonexus sp.]
MSYKVVIAPSEEPVSLGEAKYHCRVDGTDDDLLIGALIAAARELAEHETGRALCTQTRELVLDVFPEAFVLRGAPVQSLTSVTYLDVAGVERTLNPADTLLDKDNEPGYLVPAYGKGWPDTFPVPNAVRVRYVCGYGAAAAVPVAIKQWMLLAIGAMYANRESIGNNLQAALPDRFWHRLLDPYRIYEVF